MIDSRESLYELLPAYVRQQDQKAGAALRQLMAIIAGQVILLERDLARMYDNWFIETCEAWVVPYIADLLGYVAPASVFSEDGCARPVTQGFTVRREVANLLRYRRRKGTAALLDALARDVGQWPASSVELYRRLIVAQHLDHVNADRRATVDVHDARALLGADLPFGDQGRLADARRTSSAESAGLYNVLGVATFVFRMRSYKVTSTSAYYHEDLGAPCYTFSVLGNDAPLYRLSMPSRDRCGRRMPGDVPLPIGRFELEHDAAADATSAAVDTTLYGEGRSIAIEVSGWPQRQERAATAKYGIVPAELVIPADLSGWGYKVPRNRVALDPVLGRIKFATGQAPDNPVKVTYAYGFATELGGGEYARSLPAMPAHVSRRRVRALDAGPPAEGEFATIAAAIAHWQQQRREQAALAADAEPQLTALPALMVELMDSGVYRGYLEVRLGRGESLWIVAAPGTRPVLWLADEGAGLAEAISIRGAKGSRVALDGLMIAGRGVVVMPAGEAVADEDDLCELLIRHSTLVPGWGLSHDCEPRRPSEPSVVLERSRACVRIEHSIVGAIRVDTEARSGPPARIVIEDSIVDATSDTRTAIGASGDIIAAARLQAERCTVIGAVLVHEIERADDSVFVGTVTVARRQSGCMRYCYVPPGSRTPRRHRCQPDGVVAAIPVPKPPTLPDPVKQARLAADAALRTAPRFVTTRYGSPNYLRLTACTSPAIARGAEHGSEMGVYHDLFEPQRTDALAARLSDYVPAGVDASVLAAS